ncbi:MAG: ribonuclease E/G [Anaerostipes sp.]|nr:ribonuclease E/G [Anaerostipes sp.]
MKKEVLIKKYNNYIVSALLYDGNIVEFDVKDTNEVSEIGNIYTGKVKNIVANIQGAFVEIKDKQLCFYPLDECQKRDKLKIDDEILVQIKKDGTKEKKPLVTENIELSGQYLVLTGNKSFVGISNKITSRKVKQYLKELCAPYVKDEFGFIVRTSAENVSEEILVEEMKALTLKYEKLIQKLEFVTPFQYVGSSQSEELSMAFDLYPGQVEQIITDNEEIALLYEESGYKVHILNEKDNSINRIYRMKHILREAMSQKVWLKSGGFLVIQKTEAMYVIDVNSGKSIGKGNKEKHIIKINQEAAKEIARQMRLRNMSGIIMIDFIDMKTKESENELLNIFSSYAKNDSKKVTVLDITQLGIMEVTRKKEKVSLIETNLKNMLTD